MAKVKNPLFSLLAKGALSRTLAFFRQSGSSIAKTFAKTPNIKSFAQLNWRTMYQKAIALWHALAPSEKALWESLARPLHMTGFAYFISQALKPNPGLYLPLAGGTMQGDILMSSHALSGLPSPAGGTNAATRAYVDNQDALLSLKPTGARVTRSNAQTIATGNWYALSFDTETYDTGSYWSAGAPTRLTVPGTGYYLIIGRNGFAAHGTGNRGIAFRKSGTTDVASYFGANLGAGSGCDQLLVSMQPLSAGDYLELMVFQASGGNLNTLTGTDKPEFSIVRLPL
jgi:hypothetical protein